jgi:hypothetical protein
MSIDARALSFMLSASQTMPAFSPLKSGDEGAPNPNART